MAVNLSPPKPEDLLPVKGVKLGVAEAGIRKAGRKDLLLMTLAEGTRVAGVFTQNRFCAAPVQVAKEHLASGRSLRAFIVNTGNANAGTGKEGLARAKASCGEAARLRFPAGAAVFDRRDHGAAAAGTHCRRPAGVRRRPVRGQLGAGRRNDHDDRHRAQGAIATRTAGKPRGDGHGYRQGRGHDPPRHGHHARVRRHGRRGLPGSAAAPCRPRRGALVQPHQHRRRHFDQRFLHADRDRRGRCADDRRRPSSGIRGIARCGGRSVAVARTGDCARRRGRDEIRHRPRGKRQRRGGMRGRCLRDRALAACEDRVLRLRPESGADPRRRRQRQDPRSRRRPRRALPRRRVGVQRGRPRPGLPRGGRTARDAKKRDHGARRAQPREYGDRGVDLRPIARLRYHQLRIQDLGAMSELERLIKRGEALLERVEALLAPASSPVDWKASVAFRWRKTSRRGFIQPVANLHRIRLSDLHGIDSQKALIEQNTLQFVEGRTSNNALLTGARGTGKSSLVKAALDKFHRQGLRLIEVEKHDLIDLPDIVDQVAGRPERFILFCDDLSFELSEAAGYKALKVVLDGSIAATSENLLIYATSNRRHLMPEYMQENLETRHLGEEIHPGETVEEKISLSERFGLWVSFYPFDQDDYLEIVSHWLRELGCREAEIPKARAEALQWALLRGSRSGRVAWQFARDYAGRNAGDGKTKR